MKTYVGIVLGAIVMAGMVLYFPTQGAEPLKPATVGDNAIQCMQGKGGAIETATACLLEAEKTTNETLKAYKIKNCETQYIIDVKKCKEDFTAQCRQIAPNVSPSPLPYTPIIPINPSVNP